MANRKQQTDKEVAESVQRVAEAAKPAPKSKPKTNDFELNKKAKAAIAAPMHSRGKLDRVNRRLELMKAADEARMQGQNSSSAETAPKIATKEKPALRNKVKKAQAERAKTFVPDAPQNPSIVDRVKKKLKEGSVKPLSTREAGADLTGVGGQKLTNEDGKKLKSYGDYSTWKKKSSDKKK
jgi:hypothetical protein